AILGAPQRAGDRSRLRWAQPTPSDILLFEAVLPRQEQFLFRAAGQRRNLMSWETIVPFVRPIEYLILDPDVSDILVNASGRVFVERFGQLQEVPGVILSEKNLRIAVRHIARALDSDINEEKPLLDA